MLRRIILLALVVILLVPAMSVAAAGPNLLENPSFERPYIPMPAKENCRIAAPWVPYYYEGAPFEVEQGYRLAPEYKAAFYWEAPGNRVRTGELSQQYFHSYGNFEGGILQRVSGFRAGEALRFSLWVMSWSCDNESKGNCGGNTSGDPSPMHLKIGIDPTGGTDARSRNIVWSAETNSYDEWSQISVAAIAQGPAVTLFVYSYPDYRSQDNNVYLDDAELVRISAAEYDDIASPAPAAAAAPAPVVAASSWPVRGSLLGNRGGAYANAAYVADASGPVTLRIELLPYDLVIGMASGFEVYGPNGLVAASGQGNVSNVLEARFDVVAGVEYRVQIYNYAEGLSLSYYLSD
ncbi:MAG: hypothetical protein GXY52_10905 [Chloroflexi bacterium]|nr:hypothetical protein [Chloroflexota bacterium]